MAVMKKIMMTIAAVLYCCLAPALAMAQINVEEVIKQVEQKVKLADKNPTNGKMQLEAGQALIWNNLGDKRDPERSMTYANRALKIAEEQTVLQDTLKGETYYFNGPTAPDLVVTVHVVFESQGSTFHFSKIFIPRIEVVDHNTIKAKQQSLTEFANKCRNNQPTGTLANQSGVKVYNPDGHRLLEKTFRLLEKIK